MRTSVTDIETDVVDLSDCGLSEAMTLQDPLIVESLAVLCSHLAEQPEIQNAGGPRERGEHFDTLCQGSGS